MAPGASFLPSKVPVKFCLPRRRQRSKLGWISQHLSITRNKQELPKKAHKRQRKTMAKMQQ